jgi:lipopolysaccharide transport system permease protein
MTDADVAETVTVIQPQSGWLPINSRELWHYRELLYFLIVRDLKVKYKQTYIGVAWAILQPLVSTVVFTLFFGRLAKLPSDGLPYEVFALIALIPWTYFATALNYSSVSLVGNANLLSKIYFPRLLLPAGAALAALIDLAIGTAFLGAAMAFYGIAPTWRALWLLPFTGVAVATALGCGLFFASVNVKYRDVQYTIPFLTQVWMFLTPVVYPASLVPESLRWLYGLNPLVAVIEGWRWALADKPFPSAPMMVVSILVAGAMLVGGAYYFRRAEREFADVV